MVNHKRWGIRPILFGAYAPSGGNIHVFGLEYQWTTEGAYAHRGFSVFGVIAFRIDNVTGVQVGFPSIEVKFKPAKWNVGKRKFWQTWLARRKNAKQRNA